MTVIDLALMLGVSLALNVALLFLLWQGWRREQRLGRVSRSRERELALAKSSLIQATRRGL